RVGAGGEPPPGAQGGEDWVGSPSSDAGGPPTPDPRVVGKTAAHPLPTAAALCAAQAQIGSLPADRRRLAGSKAELRLGECSGAVVRIEADQRAQLARCVGLDQPDQLDFELASTPGDVSDRDPIAARSDQLDGRSP